MFPRCCLLKVKERNYGVGRPALDDRRLTALYTGGMNLDPGGWQVP